MGSIPGQGGSYMLWGSWAYLSQLLSPHVPRAGAQQQSSLHSVQLEKAQGQQRRPSSAKNQSINKSF